MNSDPPYRRRHHGPPSLFLLLQHFSVFMLLHTSSVSKIFRVEVKQEGGGRAQRRIQNWAPRKTTSKMIIWAPFVVAPLLFRGNRSRELYLPVALGQKRSHIEHSKTRPSLFIFTSYSYIITMNSTTIMSGGRGFGGKGLGKGGAKRHRPVVEPTLPPSRPSAKRSDDEDKAKEAFLAQLSDLKCNYDSRENAFVTIIKRALTYMDVRRSWNLSANDVRAAVTYSGFSELPTPLRHNVRNNAEFQRRVRYHLDECKYYNIRVEKEAIRTLSFVYDVLDEDPSTRFTVKQVDDGIRKVELDSPRGVHAEFVQMDWDFIESYEDDNDDDESYVASDNEEEGGDEDASA